MMPRCVQAMLLMRARSLPLSLSLSVSVSVSMHSLCGLAFVRGSIASKALVALAEWAKMRGVQDAALADVLTCAQRFSEMQQSVPWLQLKRRLVEKDAELEKDPAASGPQQRSLLHGVSAVNLLRNPGAWRERARREASSGPASQGVGNESIPGSLKMLQTKLALRMSKLRLPNEEVDGMVEMVLAAAWKGPTASPNAKPVRAFSPRMRLRLERGQGDLGSEGGASAGLNLVLAHPLNAPWRGASFPVPGHCFCVFRVDPSPLFQPSRAHTDS